MPMGGDAGEMEQMLTDELGQMVEWPVEFVLDPPADDRKHTKEGSVGAEKGEAEEIEESDAEAEADGGAPESGRSGSRDWCRKFIGVGDVWKLQRDLVRG